MSIKFNFVSAVLLGLCLGVASVSVSSAQVITTVAGNGVAGYSGDGASATAALLNQPHGVAVDVAGNIYIADQINNCIRKVSAGTGIITSFAGTCGSPGGYGGDNGPATLADLNAPFNVSLDGSGNLYISDTNNHVVRKVNTAGIITTVAGYGAPCFGPSACGDNGQATLAQLRNPHGLAVDNAGTIYVADEPNHSIRKISTAGVISTIAGDPFHNSSGSSGDGGPAQFSFFDTPTALALDGSGNLYIADAGNCVIRRITANSGQITGTSTITRVAGINGFPGSTGDGGPAALARLDRPAGIAVDAAGSLYISDRISRRIRRIDTSNIITTIAGTGAYGDSGDNGPATLAKISDTWQLATDGCGNLYIADSSAHRIRRVANGAVAVFNPGITSAPQVCSGKNISATGSYSGNPPDSYSWQLQSCTPGGVPTSSYNSGVLTSTGAPSTTPFSFPNTSNLACNQNYLITFTLQENCPILTTAQITKQIFIKCNPTPLITGDTSICYGGSTTLCANYQNNSQYTVQWFYQTGGIVNDVEAQCLTVNPTTNTTYNLSVTDNATGCTGSTATTVSVAKIGSDFTYQTNYTSPNNYFTVSATPVVPYTNGVAGFGDSWIVEQIDALGNTVPGTKTSTGTNPNPNCWWIYPTPNNFSGFDGTKSSGINNVSCSLPSPGRFLNGATYRITHGVWSSDCPWSQTSRTITVSGNRKKIGSITSAVTDFDVNVPDYSYLKPDSRYEQLKRLMN